MPDGAVVITSYQWSLLMEGINLTPNIIQINIEHQFNLETEYESIKLSFGLLYWFLIPAKYVIIFIGLQNFVHQEVEVLLQSRMII